MEDPIKKYYDFEIIFLFKSVRFKGEFRALIVK
jgi:hypothetical protein